MTTKDERQPIGFNLQDFNSTVQLTEKTTKEFDENEEYHPFEHREVDKPNSTAGSLMHLLKSSLGTGILAMPMAFRNAGLLFGGVGTIVVGFFCTLCVHMLVRTSHGVCKRTKNASLGFAETAQKVFETGPKPLRSWSGFAKLFVDYGLMATYYGANCVYIVFIAESLHGVINHQFDIDLNIRIYIAIVLLPTICIGQIRRLRYLVPFSAMANVMIIVVFGITLYYMFNEPLVFEDKPLVANWSTIPYFFSTVIFAMEGIGSVMPLENEMKKPQHFLGCPGVLNTAMITVVILYTIIGFFGYVRFGPEVKGSVTLNLPDGVPLAIAGQVLIAIAILFTFGLQFYVPMDILWRKISHRIPEARHNLTQILLRTGIILIMGGITMGIPNLEPFIGLVGAIFFSILGLFVPSVLETVFLWPNMGRFKWILIKNVFLAVASICALIAGTIVSVEDIIKIYTGGDDDDDGH